MDDLRWIPLPLEGAQVEEVVIFGSGKDTDLLVRLTGGGHVELAVVDVRLITGEGVVVESTPYDDIKRTIYISGPNLTIRRMAVALSALNEEMTADLVKELRTLIHPDGQRDDLSFVVNALLELACG